MKHKIGLTGCLGKMGTEIIKILAEEKHYEILGYSQREIKEKLPYENNSLTNSLTNNLTDNVKITNSIEELVEKTNIILDFSLPETMGSLLLALIKQPKPLVSGTTGHNNQKLLSELAKKVPIIWSANMSLGINFILQFIRKHISSPEDEDFNYSIIEAHHRNKLDTPSGTAIMLKEVIEEAESTSLSASSLQTKKGLKKEVRITSIREGDIFGSHAIIIANSNEIIEIKHEALNRRLFAAGAIKAMEILLYKKLKPGLYSMEDIFALC